MSNTNRPESTGLVDLLTASYPALRRIALAKTRSTGISPSSLAHEAVCRVLRLPDPPKDTRALEGVVWQLMDWLIKDRFRAGEAQRRRERDAAVPDESNGRRTSNPQLDAVSRALALLAEQSPRKAEAMLLSAVCGQSMDRIAELLGVSSKTVQRDLEFARAWLASQVGQFGATAITGRAAERSHERE